MPARRLTFDLVFYAYEEKGYFFAKLGRGYHCQTIDKKFSNLQTAIDYLETLPTTKPMLVTETVAEPVTEPVTEPVAEPIAEPVTEPVEFIAEPVTEPIAESITFANIPSPTEFFRLVSPLNTVLEVHQACNGLLDILSEKHTVATVSQKLSEYKKLFYKFQHSNPKLNQIVETANGAQTQHIAGRLLQLSDEQKQVLEANRKEKNNARAGFDAEGELREVEKPLIDIEKIVMKSLECLSSNDPHTIGVGIINLTGLRQNEQNMFARQYEEGLITHQMIVLDEFLIGVLGISKKQKFEDKNAYYARVTLAPAQLIVDAQKRFLSSKEVQAISSNYETYSNSGFCRTFRTRFTALFGTDLSTIEAFEEDGTLIKADGSPHKGRAFYACAVRATLKANNFTNSAASKYIQLCLAHENEGITIKYLGKYDEADFINPIDINIPQNIKKLGFMTTQTIEKAQSQTKKTLATTTAKTKQAPKNSFDTNAFIQGLDADLGRKFVQLMNEGSSLTNAILTIVNLAKQSNMQPQNTTEPAPKKETVTDEINKIAEAIMTYNTEQQLDTNRVVPAYSLIDKISMKVRNKPIAKKTYDAWVNGQIATNYHAELEKMNIKGGLYNSLWNGTHHRKTMDTVIDSILTIYHKG